MELNLEKFEYKKHLSEQRALFKDSFPETEGETIQKKEHYLWKFHSFPAHVTSWEYAGWINNDMVGYYAALPYQYKIGNKNTTVGMVCDVMTNSNYRGKGIFTKMGAFATDKLSEHVPFTMGYPIRKEVIPGHLKVGWKIPFELPLYIKFIKSKSLLKSKKLQFLLPIVDFILSIYNYLCSVGSSKEFDCNISNNIDSIIDYDQFNEEFLRNESNHLHKDTAFVKWRFSAPERNYKFLSIRNKKNKLVGIVIFRKIIKEGIPSYGIIDFRVLDNDLDSVKKIIKVLKNEALKDNVEAILCMMSKYSAKKYRLKSNAFLKSPFVFKLIINNLTNEFSDAELYDEKKWHLMWIDSDDL